jgi:beta-galactosidase
MFYKQLKVKKMPTFYRLLCLFLCLPQIVFSQTPREKISLDANWKFHLGHAANAEKDFNYGISNLFAKSGVALGTSATDAKFKDSAWATVQIPHDWAVELPFVKSDNPDVDAHGYKPVGGLFPETTIGWYRKHFMVEKADSGQRFQVQFDGIYRDANIWINGFYLGNNKSGYLGEAYDVTDFINFDRENVISVRVDASQYEGWFYEGAGIYRHVWLNKYQNLHIPTEGSFAYATVQNNKAVVSVETPVLNEKFTPSSFSTTAYLADRTGKIVAKSDVQTTAINVNEEKIVKQNITINTPKLWSLEDPYLYRIIVEIKENGKIVDTKTMRFGIRTVEIKTNGVFLNGQYLKIKGVNNHQDHAGLGSALPDYVQYYRIALLKNMGVNAYRTSHNAPTPELLDACDSLGMLVMDEQRSLNSGAESMNQFVRLMKRDRNHPSVFMWSIGNEEGWIHTTSVGKRIAQTFIAKQTELDPTRTCTYAADVGNVYEGVNEVIPVRSFNYRQFAVADYHHDHPNQPLLGTEMGSTVTTRGIYEKDLIRAYVPDQDITYPWWASTAETWWQLAAVNDYWLGGFVWTGFDYRGEPTPFKYPNINSHFGIMDMCGFPKNIYYYYQSWWTDKDVLHISPHWNWRDKIGQPIDVWVNTNAENVELFLNGKTLGKKDMPRNGHLQWSVNYEMGTLEAVAYKKGKRLTTKVETTNAPYKVILTPDKTTILSDGKDVSIINVSVVDKEGREVPDADNLMRFSIKGDAKIIGVGNGDPSSHEPDKCADGAWQRALFSGKCQVIVQAGTALNVIKFEAKATGLESGLTDILQSGNFVIRGRESKYGF